MAGSIEVFQYVMQGHLQGGSKGGHPDTIAGSLTAPLCVVF